MRSSGTPAAARGLVRAQQHAPRPGRRRCWRTCASGTGSTPCGCRARRCGSPRREYALRDHTLRVRRPRPRRTATTARSRAAGARRRCGRLRRAARSRTAGTPSSARPRGAPSRTSLAPGRSSPITHSHGASSPDSHVSSTRGSRRARQRVCMLSAPPTSTTSQLAALDARRELVDEQLRAVAADGRDQRWRAARCRACGASNAPGSGYRHDPIATTATTSARSSSERDAPRVGVGERAPRRRAGRSAPRASAGGDALRRSDRRRR